MDPTLKDLMSGDGDHVMMALDDLDSRLRRKEAGKEFISVLCDIVESGGEGSSKALWCLGKLGQNKVADPSSLRSIEKLALDEDPDNRENVAWALGEMAGAGVGDRSSLDVIVDLLGDEDSSVRGMAAWSAGRYAERLKLTDPRCIEKLEEMASSSSTLLQKSAEFALERIRND